MSCRSRAEAGVSGICLASGFTAEPLALAVSRRHGDMRRKHVCRWARMQGIAPPLLLSRLGEEKQPEKQLWTTLPLPLRAPSLRLQFKLSLKRPRDYVLAEANIYILGRRLLGIYNGLPTATQAQCQDACVLVPALKGRDSFLTSLQLQS